MMDAGLIGVLMKCLCVPTKSVMEKEQRLKELEIVNEDKLERNKEAFHKLSDSRTRLEDLLEEMLGHVNETDD